MTIGLKSSLKMKPPDIKRLIEIPEHWGRDFSNPRAAALDRLNNPRTASRGSWTRFYNIDIATLNYKPQPMRTPKEIRSDTLALEKGFEALSRRGMRR